MGILTRWVVAASQWYRACVAYPTWYGFCLDQLNENAGVFMQMSGFHPS